MIELVAYHKNIRYSFSW